MSFKESFKNSTLTKISTIIAIIGGAGSIIYGSMVYAENKVKEVATKEIKALTPHISKEQSEQVVSPILKQQVSAFKSVQMQILTIDKRVIRNEIKQLSSKQNKSNDEKAELELLKEEFKQVDKDLAELRKVEVDK